MTTESSQQRTAKRMKWTARIIGLLIAVGFLTVLILEGLAESGEAIETAGILVVVLNAVALAGCLLSWWREWVAGTALVLVAAGFGAHIAAYAGRNHFLAWLVWGLPYLVVATLFFISWRISGRVAHQQEEETDGN